MKKSLLWILLLAVLASCFPEARMGTLHLAWDLASYEQSSRHTRSTGEELPLLSDFLLDIADSKGKVIWHGKFGDSPEELLVPPESYQIRVRSRNFRNPVFSSPQYGDDQLVVVASGEEVHVLLQCVMVNAGIRLRLGPDFLTAYPRAVLFIESQEGKLAWSYSERRVAYFPAGEVRVVLDEDGRRKTLFSRSLKKREILDIKVVVSPQATAAGKEISLQLDTSKFWIDERFSLGGGTGGGGGGAAADLQNAMSVGMAMDCPGSQGVWVYGYVVGCMVASSLIVDPPFKVSSNLVLASNLFIDDREECLAVELRKTDLREALNLAAHPEWIGKKVAVKGDLVESYFGATGLKNTTEYHIY